MGIYTIHKHDMGYTGVWWCSNGLRAAWTGTFNRMDDIVPYGRLCIMESVLKTDMINRISLIVFFPAVLVHELMHFVPAFLLGAKPKLHLFELKPHVISTPKKDLHSLIIALFPTFIGIILTSFVLTLNINYVFHVYLIASALIVMFPSMLDLLVVLHATKQNNYCRNATFQKD